MQIDTIDEKENILLNRKELKLVLKHPQAATPRKQELLKELAGKYAVPEEHIVIDFIFTRKGLQESEARVKIYKEKPKVKAKKEEKPKEAKSEAQAGETK